jgi:hypothetical protein
MNTTIPIGRIIQEKVFQMNISLRELSERMHIKERELMDVFNYKTMDIGLLYKWSCVLQLNFFNLYSESLLDDDIVETEMTSQNINIHSLNPYHI